MRIRLAQPDDAPAIKALILAAGATERATDFDEQGWATFLAVTDIEPIRNRLNNPEYFCLLCFTSQDVLAGLLTIRGFRKIDQLFVAPASRRRGVARSLWHEARAICVKNGYSGPYQVRSSTVGVPVYASFGFVATGSRTVENGIAYTPMERQ